MAMQQQIIPMGSCKFNLSEKRMNKIAGFNSSVSAQISQRNLLLSPRTKQNQVVQYLEDRTQHISLKMISPVVNNSSAAGNMSEISPRTPRKQSGIQLISKPQQEQPASLPTSEERGRNSLSSSAYRRSRDSKSRSQSLKRMWSMEDNNKSSGEHQLVAETISIPRIVKA